MVKHLRYEDLLKQTKLLSPNVDNNENYDSIMNYVLDKVIRDVGNYVHIQIDELPEDLDSTIISMAFTMLVTHQFLVPVDEQSGNVASLSEGDTSITFKTVGEIYQTLQTVNSITDDYVTQLNQFRKVKR